ncbi:MAG: alpha/beta hydrolase [Acidiferrobacterales bacterium]
MKRFLPGFRVIVVLGLAVVILLTALRVSPWRAYEATCLLLDFRSLNAPAASRRASPMMRSPIAYDVDGRSYRGDVYRPIDPPLAAVVLLHGAAPLGKDDARLVSFAAIFARARFLVLVPDLVNMRQLKLRASLVEEITDAVLHMTSSPKLAPQGRLGIIALSVAAGPSLLAARQLEVRDRIAFILTIGSYYDMPATLNFFTTGFFMDGGEWHHRAPNRYGKWAFVLSNVDLLSSPSDRRVLSTIAWRKLKDADAEVSTLAKRLGDEGAAVYRFAANTDRERTNALLAGLPTAVRSEMRALSLSQVTLSPIRGRIIVVHGVDDPIVPYTESIALANALPVAQTRLFLIQGLLHVDLEPTPLDYWRLWRAGYTLLRERDSLAQETKAQALSTRSLNESPARTANSLAFSLPASARTRPTCS